jgi:hypothetical protein
MSPGDVCDEYTNGVVMNTYRYRDMLRMQQASHPAALVAGIVALAIVAFAVVPAFRALNTGKSWGGPGQSDARDLDPAPSARRTAMAAAGPPGLALGGPGIVRGPGRAVGTGPGIGGIACVWPG